MIIIIITSFGGHGCDDDDHGDDVHHDNHFNVYLVMVMKMTINVTEIGISYKSSQVSNQKPKKGQLPNMGMFAAKNEKPASVEKEQEEEKKPKTIEEKKSSKTTKPSGSMLSFFGKQVSGEHWYIK